MTSPSLEKVPIVMHQFGTSIDVRDRLQILLLILNEFKRINYSFNIRGEICRRSLTEQKIMKGECSMSHSIIQRLSYRFLDNIKP